MTQTVLQGRIRRMLQSNLVLVTFLIVTKWLLFAVANSQTGFDCPTEAMDRQWSFYEGPAGLHPRPCYAYHRKDLDWSASVNACREVTGGHLVTPRAFLDGWNGPWGDFWVDGWKETTDWEWISGVKLGSFSNWKSNPDSVSSAGDCVYLETTWPQKVFTWVNEFCSAKAHFICQTTTDNANCSLPLHTLSFEGFCFIFFDQSLVTWYEARALCRESGATLATIQLKDVYEMFQQNFQRSGGQWEDGVNARQTFWIGLRRYKWISNSTGDEIPLSLWGSVGPPVMGQCAFAVAQVGLSTVTLYGSPCNVTKRFVCDINSSKVFETALGLADESQSSPPANTTQGQNSSSTNAGQIVGLVVLVVLVILGIGCLVLLSVCLWRRFHLKPLSNRAIPRVRTNETHRPSTHELFCTSSSLHPSSGNTLTNNPSTHPTLIIHPSTHPTLTNHPSTHPTLTPFANGKGSNMANEEDSGCVDGNLKMNGQSRKDNDCLQESCATEAKSIDRNDTVSFNEEKAPTVKHQHLDFSQDIFGGTSTEEAVCDDVSREHVLQEANAKEDLDEKSTVNEIPPSKLSLGHLELEGMTGDISFA